MNFKQVSLSGAPLLDGKTYTIDHVVQEFQIAPHSQPVDKIKDILQTKFEVVKSVHTVVIRSLSGVHENTIAALLELQSEHDNVNVVLVAQTNYFQA